jgi:hypothetical protein
MDGNGTFRVNDSYGNVKTKQATISAIEQGVHTIPVLAGSMTARSTNGAAAGSSELSSNKVMVITSDFDAATQEYVQFAIPMPASWDEGTVTAKFYWTHGSASTFDVVWGIQAVAVGNDDGLDAAFGTAVTVTDSGGTTNDLYISAETGPMTVGGSPQAGDLVVFQVYRKAADGADTLDVDAKLVAVNVFVTINATTD